MLAYRLYEVREGGRLVPLAGDHVFTNKKVLAKVEDEMNEERLKTGEPQVVSVPVFTDNLKR